MDNLHMCSIGDDNDSRYNRICGQLTTRSSVSARAEGLEHEKYRIRKFKEYYNPIKGWAIEKKYSEGITRIFGFKNFIEAYNFREKYLI